MKCEPPNKGMNLTRSAPATGTAALAGYPQCWADRWWSDEASANVTASWSQIKDRLKALTTGDLVNLIGDLYRASPDNRHFLHGRFVADEVGLETYRRRVVDAVFPDPLSRKRVRIGEAQRLIRHYRLSTGDEVGTTDLALSFVEAGTDQAADLGYGDDKYFAALLRALEAVVDALPSLPSATRQSMESRLAGVSKLASQVGWGYPDAVGELLERKTSGPTRS